MFQFNITDGFWKRYQELVCDVVLPVQYRILNDEVEGVEKSHAIENFKIAAGQSNETFYGMVFQDSDVAKWLEAASYSLAVRYDAKLDQTMDQVIELIGKAQQEDGYLDTYFIVKEPNHKWQDLQECHELYCAGHMIEAAVAHYQATKKTTLLSIMKKNADYLCNYFGPGKHRGFPGHPEIELALVRLYRLTKESKYLELALYFINERGTAPNFYAEQAKKRDFSLWNSDPEDTLYSQAHAPVREQTEAAGHAVRAVYLYTGMAMAAYESGDNSLLSACKRLWDSITTKQMYVTGSIGSTVIGEAFTKAYDLPNDTAYAETCASIGLIFFAKAMFQNMHNSKYMDVAERALYNGVLAGMSQDGTKFFYVNPLEVNPEYDEKMPGYDHVKPQRPGWFGCACCPPNLARLVMSLADYAWFEEADTLYSNFYLSGTYISKDNTYQIQTSTQYPYEDTVTYRMIQTNDSLHTLALRIPGWCPSYEITCNGSSLRKNVDYTIEHGYVKLTRAYQKEDTIVLHFMMEPRKVYANLQVSEDCECSAITCGPLVYCFEGIDNEGLHELRLKEHGTMKKVMMQDEKLHEFIGIKTEGYRLQGFDALYSYGKPERSEEELTAIPYYLWGNRGLTSMSVWLGEEH